MALSSFNIITFLSLSGIGRQSVLGYAKYAERYDYVVCSPTEYRQLMKICFSEGLVRVNPMNYSDRDITTAMKQAQRILDQSEQNGIKVTSYSQEDFPTKLKHIVAYDRNLREKDDSAVILYYKGDNIDRLNHTKTVAVIGSRNVTADGTKAGRFVSRSFALGGFEIIGGLSIGCDSVGHHVALEVQRPTIAILAHGLQMIYPAENRQLADTIVDNGGLLISEYPIGTKPQKGYFVERDRLQGCLSDATIVIQTTISGGTMHAVEASRVNKKRIYAVEYSQRSSMPEYDYSGNTMLLREGLARPIRSSNINSIIQDLLNSL